MSENIELAKQWLAKAKNDLLNADNNLRSEHIPHDTVCFHCQQAAEKLLKAYLLVKETQPPFTHDLLMLLETILALDPDAEALREPLALLMPFAVEIRYPGDAFMPSIQDTHEARQASQQILVWFQSHFDNII
jgi:HEPN domain-containing protein